jgi:Leucine-rich repeat (LRR) protein
MRWLALWLLVGCAQPVVPPRPPVAPVAVPPVSPWAAMPVRVMAWTPSGVVQLGALPGAMPQVPERWYVEPVQAMDQAKLATLVGLVRSEHVPGLSLRGQAVAAWRGALTDLPDLKALILDGTDVDGAALGELDVAVQRLYLAHTAVDDEAIAAVAARHAGLEALDVEDTAIGDAGVEAIAGLAELRALNLAGTQITDGGGARLGVLARLEILDLGNTKVAAKTVAALRGLPLHELFLDRTRIKELATLAPLAPGLVRFDASNTAHHFTDAELGWLTGATQLVELGLDGAKLHDPLALQLIKPATLREVRLADSEITLTTIRVIAARTDLEEVDLAGTLVDDASAQAILAAPHLRIARLDSTPITNAALAGAPSPVLAELYLSRTALDDRGLALLDRTPHLTALGLGHTKLGDATIARAAKLAELQTLVLSNTRAQPPALAQLGALRGLERLYLDQTAVDDGVLAALAPLAPTLRVLHLATSDVSDAGLPALRGLTRLEELTCGDTRLDAGVAELSAWPRLRTLSLIGLEITDQALPGLAARPSLAVLDLSATEIRDPAPLAALPHLRVLGVAQTRLSPAGVAATRKLAARGVEIVR